LKAKLNMLNHWSWVTEDDVEERGIERLQYVERRYQNATRAFLIAERGRV
jgi:hypothetical protein